MVQVMYGSARDYDALLYGPTHPGTQQYLEREMTNLAHFSQHLSEAGRNFYANAQQLYDEHSGAEAMRLARAAMRKIGSVFQRDEIRTLWDLAQIQTAPLTMQRWIMACPPVRQLYQQQRCEGYADTYVDIYPGAIGENHYDYRQVMDGIVVPDEEHGWMYTLYVDEPVEGDRHLTHDEQVDILTTWDIVKAWIKQGKDDPTSQSGGML